MRTPNEKLKARYSSFSIKQGNFNQPIRSNTINVLVIHFFPEAGLVGKANSQIANNTIHKFSTFQFHHF
jgi:hypothetical protein